MMATTELKVEKLEAAEAKLELQPDPLLHQKKKERKQLVTIIIVIAVLLALGSGTFSLFHFSKAPQALPVDELHDLNRQGKLSPERGYLYGDNSIVMDEGLWWSDVFFGGTTFKVPLHFGPRDVEEIAISGQLNSSFNAEPDIYVAIDPELSDKYYTLAISELSLNLAKIMNRAPIGSCTQENENVCIEREIINCEMTGGQPVIELEYSEIPSVQLAGSCIKITGQGYNLTKSVDRLLYQWYGIMK